MMTNHVGTKLGLAFGLLIAILIGIGFFALRRMDQTNATLLNILGAGGSSCSWREKRSRIPA
jgi:hypothetical protein